MPRRILVIEDNQDLASVVKKNLENISLEVDLAHDGVAGLNKAESGSYDLIVLDLMLPGIDGMEICRRVRGKQVYTPILMLTAKSSELDRILGLEIGADDYVTKPFSIQELMARVKAIFRRIDEIRTSDERQGGIIQVGELVIDTFKRTVLCRGRPVDLTAKEFELLSHFANNPGRVYSRAQLLDTVWGYGHDGYEHTVNSHMNRLRAKIEKDPSSPEYILTVWGVGYKFAETTIKPEQA
ncbi:MAG: response regulator transcription factor [Desulfofustis sp.]|jgi:DNA-binding response OmpR family regulator|nr:response regulator transcription factor [Desulfofustis sp.]